MIALQGMRALCDKGWAVKWKGVTVDLLECRGLSGSLPYVEALMEGGFKVIVLSEH